ncbi:MAG: type I glyceraldehyde-3-phosphate dehydrogenase, partial [Gammaproteobacteria bacterium]|nr:type I glyceraldehyde-3-phosphate dehydrogenase [Gammaproteobacteria bacterium]
MTTKVGVNGFGRMGRLCLRAAFNIASFNKNDLQFIQINDPAGDAKTLAHLLEFDSIHGHWDQEIKVTDNLMMIGNQEILCSRNTAIYDTDWSECDIVIEASGKMNRKLLLEAYLEQGVGRVVVTAPVKEEGVLNIVMGINQ